MVKADVTRDYYADLELPSNASEERIKKAFRDLAKLYHPDRNPGREVDVVPKFQAVQAAHEILSDPEQKRKYDQDRAKHKSSAPIIPRRGPVPPTPPQFPPPPRRAASTAKNQNPFAGNGNNPRTRHHQPPINPEKYAPYARAGAQQWEKTKEEAQSKADAFRGFQQMKPGQSPTGERFAPPPPPRPSHYTTAERPTSHAPPSAAAAPNTPPRPQRSWDNFKNRGRSSSGTEPSPGFPGLSRTQSTRTRPGFTPMNPGGDEPPAPRSSAYATYSRGERPQASTPHSYFPEGVAHPSPQMNPLRPGKSPLRHVKSSPDVEEGREPQRPGLERISTRYAGIGGERTDVSNGGIGHRSSSARNSPIDPRWHESERNGRHSPFSRDNPVRYRSSSPKSRATPGLDSSSSSSGTSSSDEDVDEPRWSARARATPRQTRSKPASSDFGSRTAADGPASSGLFPGTKYVKPPTPRDADSGRYQYRPPPPPPPPPRNQHTSQAASNYVPSYAGTRATAQQPMSGAGNEYAGPGAPGNGPNISPPDVDTTNLRKEPSFQGASRDNVSVKFSASEWNDKLVGVEDLFRPTSSEIHAKRSPVRRARSRAKSHSKSQTSPIKESSNEFSATINGGTWDSSTASAAFVPGKFADDWAEKLRYQATAISSEDERAKALKRSFKVPASKLQQTHPRAEPSAVENQASVSPEAGGAESDPKADENVDPMDIDDCLPSNVAPSPAEVTEAAARQQPTPMEKEHASAAETPGVHPSHTAAADMNLNDLSNVAPLKPSDTGLGDLKDLNTTLPFESKASPARPSQTVVEGVAFSSLKALKLPKPPKNVIPPLENVTAEVWARYMSEMSAYMHEWNIFNKKMLNHFGGRQAHVDMTLTSNWMSALGDGPSDEEISRKIQDDPSSSGQQKAGYAAYRQWMEEDMRAREWWNVACDRHQQAVIDLGRVRELAKPLAVTLQ
ncbi:hypothetical protein GJ744_011952 [Endocarpon pusillum]|uniref:J domain-containing protein n=1 Tax=Endocarpon pusillum TaxID=364733 RepID=A0A8H7AR67_9EURO|nr:hypothetical protein GJ744_011952 [Endocarpon pusillum]